MPRFDPWPGEFPIEHWDPKFRQRVSPDGKTYGNVQEEPVRQWAAVQLVKNFGVPHHQVKFEDPVKYQNERKSARSAQRWDFGYHDPAYLEVVQSLGRSYRTVRFSDIITLLTDMGAFSLYKTES